MLALNRFQRQYLADFAVGLGLYVHSAHPRCRFALAEHGKCHRSRLPLIGRSVETAAKHSDAAQISFIPLKLRWPSRPMMMWSCTTTPRGRAASTMSLVMSTSARDGVGSPEG